MTFIPNKNIHRGYIHTSYLDAPIYKRVCHLITELNQYYGCNYVLECTDFTPLGFPRYNLIDRDTGDLLQYGYGLKRIEQLLRETRKNKLQLLLF